MKRKSGFRVVVLLIAWILIIGGLASVAYFVYKGLSDDSKVVIDINESDLAKNIIDEQESRGYFGGSKSGVGAIYFFVMAVVLLGILIFILWKTERLRVSREWKIEALFEFAIGKAMLMGLTFYDCMGNPLIDVPQKEDCWAYVLTAGHRFPAGSSLHKKFPMRLSFYPKSIMRFADWSESSKSFSVCVLVDVYDPERNLEILPGMSKEEFDSYLHEQDSGFLTPRSPIKAPDPEIEIRKILNKSDIEQIKEGIQ